MIQKYLVTETLTVVRYKGTPEERVDILYSEKLGVTSKRDMFLENLETYAKKYLNHYQITNSFTNYPKDVITFIAYDNESKDYCEYRLSRVHHKVRTYRFEDL